MAKPASLRGHPRWQYHLRRGRRPGSDHSNVRRDPAVNVLAQNNILTGNGEGVLISGGATVDLGYDSSDHASGHSNFTGLGSSVGNNILTGYTGGAGHYAIDDQNTPQGTEPDVLAEDNNFGHIRQAIQPPSPRSSTTTTTIPPLTTVYYISGSKPTGRSDDGVCGCGVGR